MSRQAIQGNAGKGYLTGSVVNVRARFGAVDLIDVRWDHDTTNIDTGYLPSGLMLEMIA